MRETHGFRLAMLGMAALATAVALAETGCSSAPLRTEGSTSAIRAAEEVGAANVPQAKLHLQLAREELDRAKALAAKGEKEQATSMLTRAEADAELAVALSRAEAEKAEAREAAKRARELLQNEE